MPLFTTFENILFTSIEVPEPSPYDGSSGVIMHTLRCPIASDGTISLLDGYTSAQEAAIQAYLTWNNSHLDKPKGARLRMMPEEQSQLLEAAIETLKSPAQHLKERIISAVLAEHVPGENRKAWCNWYGLCTIWQADELPNTPIYELTIAEKPEWMERNNPTKETEYRVAVLSDENLRIIATWEGASHEDED